MQTIIGLLWGISILALVVGTFRPRMIIRWGKEEEKTIGKVVVSCFPVILATSVMGGILTGELSMKLPSVFALLLIWSLILFIVGLSSPAKVLWWSSAESKTRKNSAVYSSGLFIFSLIGFIILTGSGFRQTLAAFDAPRKEIAAQEQKAEQAKTEQDAKITAEKKEEAAKKAEAKENAAKPAINKEQLREIQEAFNDVENQSNYKIFYAGVACGVRSGSEYLTISVNDYWNRISKDEKVGYVKHAVTLWAGMHGARGIAFDPDKFEVKIIHAQSERTLATWDSLWGPSIKD